jgi:hypothetical protein
MSKINRIYISGYKHDVQFTRACVANVRSFYPTIPITLIKDRRYGDYSTRLIERHFNCDVLDTQNRCFGWGFGKLEPLFLPAGERFLVLDSDILMLGPVLDRLEAIDADFVVQLEDGVSEEFVTSNYFDLTTLRQIDPSYRFPGYTFNTGQWVGQTGLMSRRDMDPWVNWYNDAPELIHKDIFKLGEQGLLNYYLAKGAQEERWSLKAEKFMVVGKYLPPAVTVSKETILNGWVPEVAHWCGCRRENFQDMVRGDLWLAYENAYYSQVPNGFTHRMFDHVNLLSRRVKDRIKKSVKLISGSGK